MLMSFYCKQFLTHVTQMRSVRNKLYAYEKHELCYNESLSVWVDEINTHCGYKETRYTW